MLKRSISYTDFNGDKVTEDFYFNISQAELIELELDMPGGFQAFMEHIINTRDGRQIIETFKKLILLAVGVKSADGKRFMKSDEIRNEFQHTAAYQQLFSELALDADKGADFILGAFPQDMVEAGKARANLGAEITASMAPPAPPSATNPV